MELLKGFKVVPGTLYGTPKEVWGFRTKPHRGRPALIAHDFLKANKEILALEGIRLRRTRTIESLGAHHIIHQQRLKRLPIYRAYVTVHLGRDGHIYLVKNRALPRELAEPSAEFKVTQASARKRALRSATRKPRLARICSCERMWFPLKSKLRPAFRVRVRSRMPRQDWVIFVDGETGRILRKYDNLAEANGMARVFDPNPVIALGGSDRLLKDGHRQPPPSDAYSTVTLRDLNSSGRLDGRRVTTQLTKKRVHQPDRKFCFESNHPAFEEVMAYYHIDRAIGYLESLGFRGSRAIFRAPLPVDANGTDDDNSWFSPHDSSLTFGLGGIDDAEDAEIILHELGHAIQDAICPGFGQSAEAAAMGEGFGDYFAASFFAGKKTQYYRTSVGTWDGIKDTEHQPPCIRRVDEKLTYESFDHGDNADEHDNGQIWSATLWDIRTAMQPEIADRIILESHFQLDGFTTFARGARAIIDADRNLNRGRHLARLRRVFHRRGIGPVE
ncbi:MAG TPA: M36 family metallopeptidase [Pyrinomonadaceae bacterium]|nr:M36 family metallopeptidase [Pyrinomonadaceae bacterium]